MPCRNFQLPTQTYLEMCYYDIVKNHPLEMTTNTGDFERG